MLKDRDEHEVRTGKRYSYGNYYGLFKANSATIPQMKNSERYIHRVNTGTARVCKKFSSEELEQIKEEYLEGQIVPEIAKTHGSTAPTIRRKLEQMGVYDKFRDSSSAWTEDDDAQLRMLYFNEIPIPSIAVIMNRTKKAISTRISYKGLIRLKKIHEKEKSLRNGNSESDKQN